MVVVGLDADDGGWFEGDARACARMSKSMSILPTRYCGTVPSKQGVGDYPTRTGHPDLRSATGMRHSVQV